MSDTGQIQEHFIRFLFPLKQTVNAAIHVEPGKRAFNFPAIAAILLFASFSVRQLGGMVFPS